MGVEHALLPEKGLCAPGEIIVAPIPTPVPTVRWVHFPPESAVRIWRLVWTTGKAWFKVPAAIKFVLTGKPAKWISGKDIIYISSE